MKPKENSEAWEFRIGIKENRLTVIAPIEDTPAFSAGIQAGDFITKVNDDPTKDLTLMEAVPKNAGQKGTTCTLTIIREGIDSPLIFTLTRDTIKIQSVRNKVFEGTTGYIRITQFQESTPDDLSDALQSLKEKEIQGLILDLRNNPGGLLTAAVGVSEQFFGIWENGGFDQGSKWSKRRVPRKAQWRNVRIPHDYFGQPRLSECIGNCGCGLAGLGQSRDYW